ncbi:MAG: hypothetical protein CVV27_06915 [Candidatus Melainabacteria bacterium HGW-Melainabacteria-1]|nr:MAG: hypothetical protein CVV27_06915 [Candidatus Melainabacteria bacterium HGW-Melainabacteria-1]
MTDNQAAGLLSDAMPSAELTEPGAIPLQATQPSMAMSVSPWLRSWRWDGFWMLSGFWVPTLLLLLPLAGAEALILTFTLCFWIGHRVSSLYLAWCVGEYQSVLQARRSYFLGLPLLLLGLVMGFLLCPLSLLPMPRLERIILLALADYAFSLYHFSVQHYGVLSVYRSKLPHGQKDPVLLKWDWWMCLAVSGVFTIVIDLANGELKPFELFGAGFGAMPVTDQSFALLRWGLTALVLLIWGIMLRRYLRQRQGLARILYLSTLCYMTMVSFHVGPLLYFAMVQIQHWFVSLGLTTFMAANSRQPARGWYRPWAWINARAFGPLLVLMLLSIGLTPVLEADYYILGQFNAESLTVKGFLTSFGDSIWLYVFGGLAFFSSFVHYLYDRGVFRFSDPLTRQAALSLLRQPESKRADAEG